MAQQQDPNATTDPRDSAQDRPRNASDGPPSIDKATGDVASDRQIAQERQQSTGQGMGQS